MALTGSAPGGSTAVPTAPPPPPGPGVQPPFVAPPTEGTSRRRWIAAGISAGVAVLLCAAGVVGIIGIGVLLYQYARDQAEANVTAYLTALQHDDFEEAYRLQCDRLRATTTRAQFQRAQEQAGQITSFE